MGAAAAAVVFIGCVEIIPRSAEGQVSHVTGCRGVAVAGVTGPLRLEGASGCTVGVAVEAAADGVARFRYAGTVVLSLGVADLAETAVGGRINETVHRVGIGDAVGSSVGPGPLQLGPNHGEVAGAVGVMALLAEHIL